MKTTIKFKIYILLLLLIILADRKKCAAQSTYIKDNLINSFITEINNARNNPKIYGNIIGIDLSNVQSSNKLIYNKSLSEKAAKYLDKMIEEEEGDLVHSGLNINESLASGNSNTLISSLIKDKNIDDLGHRKHLLGICNPFKDQTEIGIAYCYYEGDCYLIIWTQE